MTQEQINEVRRQHTMIAVAALAVLIGYCIYCFVNDCLNVAVFYTMVGIFLVLFWLLLDVIEPIRTGKLMDATPEKKQAFYKAAACGFIGYVGLATVIYVYNNFTIALIGMAVWLLMRKKKEEFIEQYHPSAAGKETTDHIEENVGELSSEEVIEQEKKDE